MSMYFIAVVLFSCLFHKVCPTCDFQDSKYDLSALDQVHGWPVSLPTVNGTLSRFEINLFSPVSSTAGCVNSSICLISGNTSKSYGDVIVKRSSNCAIADSLGGGFSLYVLTSNRCGSVGVYRASINFACGPNLGAPELILKSGCQVNFYWKTLAACSEKPKSNQVPCYIIDDEGNKRDLSPLILRKSGYFVNTLNPAVDFVINVCADIVPDNQTQNCPQNSSACRIIGNEYFSFGIPQERVYYSKEGMILTYRSIDDQKLPSHGCRFKPKTTVTFKCPSRGRSQPPKLVSESFCQYEVEWETEYACPENTLKGSIKECKFTTNFHGVEIDLTPLKKRAIYNITSRSNSNISFTLSVCGGLSNFTCEGKNWKSVSACMIDLAHNSSIVVGKADGANFIYADQEISLTYSKGSLCPNEGIEQSSTINFVCDQNVSEGEPRHVFSDHCSHFFEWRTKHACLKHPLDTPCSVTFDKKKVNLQKLMLTKGDPWEAIDRRILPSKENAEYYINVCGQVSSLGNLSSCGEDSSACVLLYNGSYLNLGNFKTAPVYDEVSSSVKLHYIGGSACEEGKFWSSVINFICRPGHINSEPVLTRINDVDCIYEFEWLTAEACPEGVIYGTDCKVYDDNLGIDYDLTSLKSNVYEVDTESYKYFIGVCESIPNSPCSVNRNQSDQIGVCQVDKRTNSSLNTGQPTSHLIYMDGVVNLTYLSGDPYNDENKTARTTIIIFMCDYNTVSSTPYFFEEIDFAYVFHWYTDLVCPRIPSIECIAHDPVSHLVYDLSGLSLPNQNWVTIISDDQKERQIYLNVCKSLSRFTGCNPGAAACMVETTDIGEKVVVPNLGRLSGPPVLDNPGHLSLTYKSGDSCVAYGENITYSTVIHFLCGKEAAKNGPIFLSKLGACEYTFLWTTKAACPTSNLETKASCMLTDPDSGFTFDLTSLHMDKQPYIIQTSNRTYQLNICGKIAQGCTPFKGKTASINASVCETDSVGNIISELATANSYSMIYSAGQDLTLKYKSSSIDNSVKSVIIKFPCTTGPSDQDPIFITDEEGYYIFEMKTTITCIPSHFDCNTVDNNGNEYDLSPLAKFNGGNWEAVDHRTEYSNLRYYINFCRPLNKADTYKCPGGASTACQVNTARPESTGLDLGSQKSLPVVSNKGTVVVRYENGSLCQNGQLSRSTTINLFCGEEEGNLIFIGETPECEYVFSLDTPAACPIQSSRGQSCIVKDPVFGYIFDLNPLKIKNNNYNVSVGEYIYSFNVCGKLNGFENECANSGACQLKPSDPSFYKSIGQPSDVLTYRKGLITLEYQSGTGKCHGKYNRSTKITFTCHHGHEDKDGPTYISEAEDCSYLFEWPTVHACPPFDVIECSVIDENGTYYDLSKLSMLNDNYYVKYPFSDKNTFAINVCRSVVHTPDSVCSYTSAVCLMDNSKPSEPLNLGRVNQGPYIDNGKIKISYTSGDPCNAEHTNTARFMQTIIEFTCAEHIVHSAPQFVGKDDCTYYFDWSTAYACPPKPIISENDCIAMDPNTDFVYNLTALKSYGTFKIDVDSYRYHISVCSNVSSSVCNNGTGLCQEELLGGKRFFNGGQSNGNLQFTNEGVLFLNYSDGDLCHNGRFRRNTIIEFSCGPGIGAPQFLYETHDCTYFFNWRTEYACQISPHCVVKNGSNYIDLTSLTNSYHVASSSVIHDDASYYVSLCSPLPNLQGLFCPPGAGICRAVANETSSRRFWQSLGKVEVEPFIDFMGHVTVIYTNGSTCLTNSSIKNRARIIFVCDNAAGRGEPVLIDDNYDECLFLFEWRTNIVCPEEPDKAISTCNYTDNSKGVYFDLSVLRRKSSPNYVISEKDGINYTLNVCSSISSTNLTDCGNAAVCSQQGNVSQNFGTSISQHFSYDGRRLRLSYFDGGDCPSGEKGRRSSEIFFICDPNANLGVPVIHKKYTCLVVFMWKTSLVCQNLQEQCAFEIAGNHYDFNLLSSLSHNWETIDSLNTRYWINICRGVRKTNATLGCSPTAAVCMEDRVTGSYVSLGTVQTMEVKSINSTDLLLSFKSGDHRACSNISSDLLTPTTRVFMRCGNVLGKPKMFSGPDNKCYYDFLWESSLACADKPEEVKMDKNGIIKDPKFGVVLDLNSILNRMFVANGTSDSETYTYLINMGGVYLNSSDSENACAQAAVCQTKYGKQFHRDIGSIDSSVFILRGSELHLTFTSHTRPCGKNRSKNVTTILNMQCSVAAGLNNPVFLYESGNCDYVFDWQTEVACPKFDKMGPDDGNDGIRPTNPVPNPYQEVITQSSHVTEITLGVIFAVLILMVVIFIVGRPQRRSYVYHRVRSLFGGVKLPYFRYKRCAGERLVLVDASQPHDFDDDKDVEMLS